MLVRTKACGLIELDEKQKIVFPKGVLGLGSMTEFILFDAPQEPFMYLQSLEREDIAFILIDPFLFRPDYVLDIDNEVLAEIAIASPNDSLVLAIVTVRDGQALTANLAGPLVINRRTHQGMQVVLADARWTVRHDIMAELAEAKK